MKTSRAAATLLVLAPVLGYAAGTPKPGSPDRTFGKRGLVLASAGSDRADGRAMVVQPDGKIIVGGNVARPEGFGSLFTLMRFTERGTLDPTFGQGGVAQTSILADGGVQALALQPDGMIVAAGSARGNIGDSEFAVARYDQNGQPDPNFGSGGTALPHVSDSEEGVYAVSVAGGNIVLAGRTVVGSSDRAAVVRLLPNGQLDPSFDGDGILILNFGRTHSIPWSMLTYPDERILIGGDRFDQGQEAILMRLLPDGTPDPTFGTNGQVEANPGVAGRFNSLALSEGESILAGGLAIILKDTFLDQDFYLARFLPNGQPDTTFGTQGAVTLALGRGNDILAGVAIQADGKIVAGGSTAVANHADFVLTRWTSRGELDAGFGKNGVVTSNFGKGVGSLSIDGCEAVALRPDGRIVLAGDSDAGSTRRRRRVQFAVARYVP